MESKYIFPLVLGLTDGIITALMIATAELLSSAEPHLALYLRIAVGSAAVGAISFFMADYSSMKQDLMRLSKKVNPNTPENLLGTKLEFAILRDSATRTAISAFAGFVGALIPLLPSLIFVSEHLVTLAIADASLAILGLNIARIQSGSYIFWSLLMGGVGVFVMFIGSAIQIVP